MKKFSFLSLKTADLIIIHKKEAPADDTRTGINASTVIPNYSNRALHSQIAGLCVYMFMSQKTDLDVPNIQTCPLKKSTLCLVQLEMRFIASNFISKEYSCNLHDTVTSKSQEQYVKSKREILLLCF